MLCSRLLALMLRIGLAFVASLAGGVAAIRLAGRR